MLNLLLLLSLSAQAKSFKNIPYQPSRSVADGGLYQKLNSQCDGLPRVALESPVGTCVGLVYQAEAKDDLVMPRALVPLPNSEDFILTDMGGWQPANRGKILRLRKNASGYTLETIFRNLELPHGLAIGPDNLVYVGVLGEIFKFDPHARIPEKISVVKGMPTNKNRTHMHPLVNFTFGKGKLNGDLIVNVGAPSDACLPASAKGCDVAEAKMPFASIWRFKYLGNFTWNQKPEIFARGLRNSMVLLSTSAGQIIQMENSRDLKPSNEPFEEINVLEAGKHYGWPYCYNEFARSQEWLGYQGMDCISGKGNYQPPYALLPPHSAPLGAIFYEGSIAALKGNILVALHGYKPSGHRIIALSKDSNELPLVKKSAWKFLADGSNGGQELIAAKPEAQQGGVSRFVPYSEPISKWWSVSGIRPRGAPVGLAAASDGSIFIVEDKNKSILRLAKDALPQFRWNENTISQRPKLDVEKRISQITNRPELLGLWSKARNVFRKNCSACHSGFSVGSKDQFDELRFIYSQSEWIGSTHWAQGKLWSRISGESPELAMPPSGRLSDKELLSIKEFFDRLN